MIDRDVVFSKTGKIKRSLYKIKSTTGLNPDTLGDEYTIDIFLLNAQRAIQASAGLASHIIACEGMGVPQSLKHIFSFLEEALIIDAELSKEMQALIGFRNVILYGYTDVDTEICKEMLTKRLQALEDFYTAVIRHYGLDQ